MLLWLFIFTTALQDMQYYSLDGQWNLTQVSQNKTIPATVPGFVQLDLIAANMLEDPFRNQNEKSIEWVEQEDWLYTLNFTLPSSYLIYDNIELVFDGIDTIAEIKLNSKITFEANNMFREWVYNIKNIATENNQLNVTIKSPLKFALNAMRTYPYNVPVQYSDDKIRCQVFLRKAPYNFGWDWGPRVVTSGIWRSVGIRAYNTARISNIAVNTISISNEKASMELWVEIDNTYPTGSELLLEFKDTKLVFTPTEAITKYNFTISAPNLWWPNGAGSQYLYDYSVALLQGTNIISKKSDSFGIRTVKLVRKADISGESFYFEVNGIPIFAKGANYIPSDSFPSRTNSSKYESIIKSAAFANMNMLRIWGGGTYETNEFYSYCDKYGIMVWQDFMFACAMYPGDEPFINNIKAEFTYNIKRLRTHPSLVHWCGNNEVWEAFNNWGFRGYETSGGDLSKTYTRIFQDILPSMVKELDPYRSYTHTSPLLLGNNYGDQHFWIVWHGGQPFSAYATTLGRFFSEYGFQGFPSVKTFAQVYNNSNFTVGDSKLEHRQKAGNGYGKISSYMNSELGIYNPSVSFEDYTYKTQVLQGIGIGTALYSHRFHKPTTMGTIYWQLNDCWPVVSWSSMDYFGRYKGLHYIARKAFMPVMVYMVSEERSVIVYGINDRISPVKTTTEVTLYADDGTKLKTSIVINDLPIDKPIVIAEFKKTELQTLNVESVYANLSCKEQSDNSVYVIHLTALNNLPNKKVEWIQKSWTYNMNRVIITLQPKMTLRYVQLEVDEFDGVFDDNLFDIIAGQEKNILFTTNQKLHGNFTVKIRYLNKATGQDTLIINI